MFSRGSFINQSKKCKNILIFFLDFEVHTCIYGRYTPVIVFPGSLFPYPLLHPVTQASLAGLQRGEIWEEGQWLEIKLKTFGEIGCKTTCNNDFPHLPKKNPLLLPSIQVCIWVFMSGMMIAHHPKNLGQVRKIETSPIFPICHWLSQDVYDFKFLVVGKLWDGQQTAKSLIVWDFPHT